TALNGSGLLFMNGTTVSYKSTLDSGIFNNQFAKQTRNTISLTTTGSSGAASYNSSTGVFNIPQYAGTTYTNGRGITLTSGTTFGIDTTPAYTWTSNNTFSTSITTPQIYGSSSIAGNLNIGSTSNATLGNVYLNPMSAGNTNTNGCVFVGRASADPLPIAGDPNHIFGIVNDSSNKQMFSMWSFGSGGTFQNNMHFYRANGTIASPRALTAGQFLVSMGFRGYDGTTMSQSAVAYQVFAPSAWTNSNHEARVQWEVTPNGSITRNRAMQLNGDGSLWLTPNPTLTPYRPTTQFVLDGATSGYTGDFRALLQSTTTNGAGMIFGESTSSESYIIRYGSSYSGTYATGANVAASFNIRSGSSHNQTLVLSGLPVITQAGTTTTNIGSRLSATGLRVAQLTSLTTDATSTLQVVGSFGTNLSTKTNTYTATETDHTLLADATSGGFTITLPTAATCGGRIYVIKKIDATGNVVTIGTTSSQTIDGVTTKTLNVQNSCMQLQSNGSNWFIIASF
ncbi:MAG: hypothetical protein NTZ59_11765, partial [Bacteroidetes bacterium]|nr:hypothetical protein [Bacteroidota bacterium]